MKDRDKYLAAAALTVAGISVVAVGGTRSEAVVAPPALESTALQEEADRVFVAFNGSQVERDAGAVLQAYALNGGMDACMDRAGFPSWDWSLPRAQNPPSHGLESSHFFAPPLSRSFTSSLMASSGSIRADADARRAEPAPDELKAVVGCIETTPPTSDADAPSSPEAAGALREQWWAMLGRLDAEFGNQADHAQCLTKVGIADLGTVESRDDAVAALTELQPPEADLPTRSTDARAELPGWQRLIAAEARWESADWMCRAATYNAHLDDVAAAVTEFEEQHAAEIAQARQGWINILAKAEELGYQAGVYGPVGVP